VDIFIGGGGDDLAFLGLGVVADAARDRAAETGRPVLYFANGRLGRVRRAIAADSRRGENVCLVGHSWGGPDAWRAAAWAATRGLPVDALITIDPVAGPLHWIFKGELACPWLNVVAAPTTPDRSDRLTELRGLSRKPSGLPTVLATREVVLDLHHGNVAGMLALSDAWRWVDAARAQADDGGKSIARGRGKPSLAALYLGDRGHPILDVVGRGQLAVLDGEGVD
jgi:pimeloyl-ACP methyl ester carboxylesterase